MTCDPVFSPRGRSGLGVVQPQSGLDYPFVGFSFGSETLTQKILRLVQYPVRAIIINGSFSLKIQPIPPPPPPGEEGSPYPPPFYVTGLSPLWPSEVPLETELHVLNSINTGSTITGEYLSNINAAISYYYENYAELYLASSVYPTCSIDLHAADIEMALVDTNNLVVGWAVADTYSATGIIGNFPEELAENSFLKRWMKYRQRNCGAGCEVNFAVESPPWAIATDNEIRYLLADLYFEYDDPELYAQNTSAAQHPLRIKWLYGLGCIENGPINGVPEPTHAADILIVDAADNVVFDSTVAASFTSKTWGADYHIYEWITSSAMCRIVAYTTWAPDELNVRSYAINLSPENAVLDERAVYKLPKRVKSIQVLNTNLTQTTADLVCGYNIGFSTVANTSRGLRHTNEITINAEPGLGRGRYSDCTNDPPAIVSLNGATGPDITVAATDCLWTRIDTIFNADQTKLIQQKTTSVNPVQYPDGTTKLLLGSNCPACCDCDDYVNTARYMNCVRDRYTLIGEKSHDILLQHSDNITRWLEQRACRLKKPLKIVMTPQLCPYIDVVVQFCNLCEKCAEDVNITVAFNTYPSGGIVTILHCYTILSAGLARNFPYYIQTIAPNTFNINFGKVSAGNSADIQFRVEVAPALPITVTATVTGTKRDKEIVTPILAGCEPPAPVASESVITALACDNSGKTVSVC